MTEPDDTDMTPDEFEGKLSDGEPVHVRGPLPDYHCPQCGELSGLVIGPTQATCTNTFGCPVLVFNPSLPDGGMSDAGFVELPGSWEDR